MKSMNHSITHIWLEIRNGPGLLGSLFEGLDEPAVELLASMAVREYFIPGGSVFREGSTGDSMYVIATGQFSVSKTDPLGGELELRVLGRGEVFGEIGLLEQVYRSATVTSLAMGVTFRLDRADLDRHPELSIHIYRNLGRILARRLRLSTDEVLMLETSLRLEENEYLIAQGPSLLL
jgi:CRP/FNR family transcriptional regulator